MLKAVQSASVALAVALLAAGCAAGPRSTVRAERAPGTPGEVDGSAPGTGTPDPVASDGAGQSAARCTSAGLRVRLQVTGGGMGRRYALLELTNRSSARCRVAGFVDLRLYGQGGSPVPSRVVRDRGSAVPVTLAPGGSAWATVSWTVIPGVSEANANPCQPPTAGAEVRIPDAGAPVRVDFAAGSICEGGRLTVSPLTDRRPG